MRQHELIEAFDASGVRGLLTVMLGIFDLDGSHDLTKTELNLSASALGYKVTASTWEALITQYGKPGSDSKDRLDLGLIQQHFSSKYDAVLEGVLRQLMGGLVHVAKRSEPLVETVRKLKDSVERLTSRCKSLEDNVDTLQGGVARDRKRKLEVVARRWQHGVLVVAFDGWAKVAAGQRELLQRTARHWQNGIISAAWRRWKEMVAELAMQRNAIAQAIGRMRSQLMASAFASWFELVEESRARWQTANRALLRWTQQHLATAFTAWQQNVSEAKQQRAAVAKALGRMLHRAACMAFQGWKEAVETAKWQRQAITAVLGRMRNRVVSMTFETWHESVRASVDARHTLLLNVTNRLMSRTLLLTFERWKSQFEEQRDQLARARRLMGRMLHALAGKCFDGWYAFCEEQKRIFRRAAYAIGPGRELSIAFHTWSIHVREILEEAAANTFEAKLAAGVEAYLQGKGITLDAIADSMNALQTRLENLPAELEARVAEAATLEEAQMEQKRRDWEEMRLNEERLRSQTQLKSQQGKQEQLLQKIMRRWRRQYIGVAFDAWLQMLQVAKDRLNRAARTWNNTNLARTWRTWVDAWRELRAEHHAQLEAEARSAREKALLLGLRSVGVHWFEEMLMTAEGRRLLGQHGAGSADAMTIFDLLDKRYTLQMSGTREAAQVDRDLKTLEMRVGALNEQSTFRHEAVLKMLSSVASDPSLRKPSPERARHAESPSIESPTKRSHRPLNAPPQLSFGSDQSNSEQMEKLVDAVGAPAQWVSRRRSLGQTNSSSVPTLPMVKHGAGGAPAGRGGGTKVPTTIVDAA